MDGAKKITGRIAANIEAEITSIQVETRRQADETTARHEAQAKRGTERIAARGRRSAEERQTRLISVTQLGARKLELVAKQETLAKVRSRAMKRLTSLLDGGCVGLLMGLATKASFAEREEVILPQRDRTHYDRQAVTQTNEKLGDGHLTLSVQVRPIQSGLILSDGGAEVNCTFETLARLLQGEMDRTVAEVPFD